MISTRDGHNLLIGDECLVVSLEEDSKYIESLTECTYKGSWVQDNKQLIAALPLGCSGTFIPETQIMYRFENIHDINEKFDLLEHDVRHTVIEDLSTMEGVVKKKLKD